MTMKGVVTGIAIAALAAATTPAVGADLERGRYLATIMLCGDCHTGGSMMGQPDPARFMAGSEAGFGLPGLGIFYPPNLTNDVETGLGTWSEDDIVTALRTGVRPDGRELAPIMPWRFYQHLSDQDARALAQYIKSLPPVRFQAPAPVGPDEQATAPYLSMTFPQTQPKPKTG